MLAELLSLKGKIAIVTGAGSGLGRAMALLFGEAGATIVLAGRKPEPLAETAKLLREKGAKSIEVSTDVRNEASVQALADATVKEFGRIDIVINNAGGAGLKTFSIEDMEAGRWDNVVALNLRGPFLLTQAAGRHMIEKGEGGSFINISSEAGVRGSYGSSAYCSAKSGVQMLTRVTAGEWGKHNIRANCIAPSFVPTEGALAAMERSGYDVERVRKGIPLGRFGTQTDVAQLALFLCSKAGSYITGQTISLDGGPSLLEMN